MLQAKENVLDRIEQTFVLFKNNFKELLLPFLIFNLSIIMIVMTVSWGFFKFTNYEKYFTEFNPALSIDLVMYITILIFFVIIYLIVSIWFNLWLLKWIKQWVNWEKVTPIENLAYGFKSIFISFQTYWYIFSYIFLIPAILFIVWWILFNIGFYADNNEILKFIWWALMIVWAIIWLAFAIYRGVRTSFSIASAIDKDSFTKENFLESISFTNDNWWRIVWNIFLAWLIVSLVSWVFWMLLSSISFFWNDINISEIRDIEDLKIVLKSMWDINIYKIISNSLDILIKTITSIFVIVFSYILFLRLQDESNNLANSKEVESIKGDTISNDKLVL